MGVRYSCIHCKQSVTVDSGDFDQHDRDCPGQQPVGPADIGFWWLVALAGLVLACCLWGSP